jgi:hypothetical protein
LILFFVDLDGSVFEEEVEGVELQCGDGEGEDCDGSEGDVVHVFSVFFGAFNGFVEE